MRVALVALVACHVDVTPTFVCATDMQCVDGARAGTCEPDGHCAFPDSTCATGSRYDGTAGDLAGSCIAPPANWWNTAWTARMPLSIANATAQDLPSGFQVGVRRDLEAAPCLTNDDGRIVFGNLELERIVDSVAGPDEWIWFRLVAPISPGATATGYWLYCGNAAPPPPPADPTRVFDRFESFDTPLVNWQTDNHTAVVNGQLEVGGNGNNASAFTNERYGPGTAVDMVATNPDNMQQFSVGFHNNKNPPLAIWYGEPASTAAVPIYEQTTTIVFGTEVTIDSAARLYGVEYETDRAVFRYEGAITGELMFSGVPGQLEVALRNNTGSAVPMRFDMIRIRATTYPIPEVTIGVPEPY